MLSRITIHNLVIVRALDLELMPGMTALTGETGAGKSILIDALALALGDRTDNTMIRTGCDKAEVSVSFEIEAQSPAAQWLDARDLGVDGDCLLRRVLVRDGRSRAYINGIPSTQSLLRELGSLLVDIHGQHAHQSLLRPSAQRELLDDFAGLRPVARKVGEHYALWHKLAAELHSLKSDSQDRVNRLDYLRFQIDELNGLDCDPAAFATLEAEHGRLAHADRLLGETGGVLSTLDNENTSLRQTLARARVALLELSRLDERLGDTIELLEGAEIQIDEAITNLRHYRDGIELEPARLQQIDQQLGQLHDVARKHRVEPAELSELLQGLEAEAEQLNNADASLADLEARLEESRTSYMKAAEALSKKRRKAATTLSKTITDSMQTLSMKGGRFLISCEQDEQRANAEGIDQIRFMVAANPGQSEAPLSDVASGGELSRISLAIQVATADCGAVPTLIFDEVDVGIGGAVAEIVGQLLRRLGSERQVLCVTHLPQVASQAHRHMRVHKLSDGHTTETRIDALDDQSRVDEVARMLGGIDITEQTRRHADEMIVKAQTNA